MEENKTIHNEEGKSPPSTDDSPQQEQQLNTPSIDEPNVPTSETITEVEQPLTINYKPQTEEMEVQHHTSQSYIHVAGIGLYRHPISKAA